jgi:hypothetical protein
MKKLIVLALIFAASAAYAPAFAGGCGGGGGGCGGGGGGGGAAKGEFGCSNQCPLAQAANTRRSIGSEAAACSAAIRATMAAAVQRNLAKI